MNRTLFLLAEFFLLFIIIPIILSLPFYIWFKVALVTIGFIYVLWKLKTSENISFQIRDRMPWKSFFKQVGLTFTAIAILTIGYVYLVDSSALFYVPLNDPGLYVVILLVYSVFSVWPQEIIYRTFFFERYKELFQSKRLFVFINAIVFSLAHLFFRNTLVLVLTFIGGLIFGFTYLKYRSTTAVSIEHAIYGNWLFTVGMGQMLAFPGMETD